MVADELTQLDDLLREFVGWLEERGVDVIMLSEYGIDAVDTPVHINRALREHGLIQVREELGRELLDAGACKAFAVADHQLAHVYINDKESYNDVKKLLSNLPGVAHVLDDSGKSEMGIDHERSGDLVVVAERNAWFTYYYWTDDARAPDFARCVDIHRKPGYDPVELFVDPDIAFPWLTIGGKLVQKELGFRYLMDVIPLDASLVKGSHGAGGKLGVFVTRRRELVEGLDKVEAVGVRDLILQHLGLI